ncbi:MAG: hypothetical protein NC918_00655 [Candidatus Omnitrophica bacterium]|nr:hypothetical protein [Candidatus Omnitrophota bacterium]
MNQSDRVIEKAIELADALNNSKKDKDPMEFAALLFECNLIIEEISNLNYGAICSKRETC